MENKKNKENDENVGNRGIRESKDCSDMDHGSRSAIDVLHRYLSNQEIDPENGDANETGTRAYKTIGFGQCGLTFDHPTQGAAPSGTTASSTSRVYRAAQTLGIACRVPTPYSYVSEANRTWWSDHGRFLAPGTTSGFPLPTSVLVSQRIPPLPSPVRDALIELYCPRDMAGAARANPSNRDCLARVYLGRRRAAGRPLPPNFTLRNYNLCLDQMVARQMAEALAIMHWSALTDGYDVEFVLGSDIEFDYRQHNLLQRTSDEPEKLPPNTDIDAALGTSIPRVATRIWLLDFNLCSRWSEESLLKFPEQILSQLVLAFFENDPYYPLPLAESAFDKSLWIAFQNEYFDKSERFLQLTSDYRSNRHLPSRFIEECIARERQKLVAGLGHGHRDLKG